MIRKPKKSDFHEMMELTKEFMIDYNRKIVLKGIQKDFMRYKDMKKIMHKYVRNFLNLKSSKKCIYVYEENNKLLGYIYGEIYKNNDKALSVIGNVEEWFVSKKYRSNKIGKKLWDKMMSFFKKNNVKIVKVEIFTQNKKTLNIYI